MAIAGPFLLKSISQGAATEVFAAVHPKALPLAGQYLADCNTKTPSAYAQDASLALQLWAVSERIVQGLLPNQ
jgi:hypothetical protein